MADSWLVSEKPLAFHPATSKVYLSVPPRNNNGDVKDVPSYGGHSPCHAVRTSKTLSLPAAFVSVSVLVLLVYLCSLSFRSRISKRLFGRKLAGGTDGEGGGESGSCTTDTDEDAFSSPQWKPRERPIPSSKGRLHAAPWHAGSETPYRTPPSAKSVTAAPVERPSRAVAPHLRTMEWPRRSKRKQRGKDAVGREAKKNRLEAPIQQGLPGTSVPLLDPDVDLLIGDGKTLSADVWLRGDAIAHSTPLALHVEDAVPMEEYVGQRSQTVLMPTSRMSPLTLTGNLSTLDSTGLTSISPLSFFESVLSETSQANPGLHPDEWLMSGEAEVVEEALGLINPNTTPALLGSSDETQEGAEYRGKVSAGVTEGQVYARAPSSYKMPKSDSLVEAVQEPAEVSSSIPSTSTDPEHGVEAGVLESSLLRSLLLSTSSGSTPSSSRAKTEAALMVVSRRAHDATETLFASRGWLEAMLRGVSDQLLRTHPFHRLPEVEPELPRHPFNEDKAAGFRRRKQNVVWLLSACRHLLKKEQLTSDELGALMSYTERLCGYATGSMPTYSTSKAAIDILGRAFMVLDTLHCLAEVLGSSARKEEWWPAVVRHIENAGYRGTSKEYVMGKTYWSSPVVNALRVALDYYRVGTRPPLRLVVGLKLAMLLSPNSTGFKESKWDPWREDALQWLQSIRPSAQINLNKQTVGI